MFYSRLSKSLEPEINVVDTYLTLIDVENARSFMIEEFMTGYTDFRKLLALTPEELTEKGCPEFTLPVAINDSMQLLAKFVKKGWMDTSLDEDDYFFLKTYGWTKYEGQGVFDDAGSQAKQMWIDFKAAMDNGTTDLVTSPALREITDKVFELYTWDNVMAELHKPDYVWGYVHGDFHTGQMMR